MIKDIMIMSSLWTSFRVCSYLEVELKLEARNREVENGPEINPCKYWWLNHSHKASRGPEILTQCLCLSLPQIQAYIYAFDESWCLVVDLVQDNFLRFLLDHSLCDADCTVALGTWEELHHVICVPQKMIRGSSYQWWAHDLHPNDIDITNGFRE